ncbi:hypothetical protein TNCV_1791871 [Trichonephila clavipes]|nr:hypothetical protein TNCV_1791871 [Trichonephila clavipes]
MVWVGEEGRATRGGTNGVEGARPSAVKEANSDGLQNPKQDQKEKFIVTRNNGSDKLALDTVDGSLRAHDQRL